MARTSNSPGNRRESNRSTLRNYMRRRLDLSSLDSWVARDVTLVALPRTPTAAQRRYHRIPLTDAKSGLSQVTARLAGKRPTTPPKPTPRETPPDRASDIRLCRLIEWL